MSHSDFFSTLRSSDHDFIATLRFLEEYTTHVQEYSRHHQVYRNFVPRFDLEQHDEIYELYGELPGFRTEDVIIEAHDDRNLQVSGAISRLTSQPTPTCQRNVPKNSKDTKSELQDTPLVTDPLEVTTAQERYLDARFGDVLDPHAEFIHAKGDTNGSLEIANEIPKVRYLITERHPCSFSRNFHFPAPIKKDEITAVMQDGILHIIAPRAPMLPSIKVQVKEEPGVTLPSLSDEHVCTSW